MILDMYTQRKYHTFVLCRTNNKLLAQKLPNTVFSINNKIIHDQHQLHKDIIQYNYPLNAIKYQYYNHKIILAQANYLIDLLPVQYRQVYKKYGIVIYNNQLSKQSQLQFYLYLKNQEFIIIQPYYYFDGILFFSFKQDNKIVQDEKFKDLNVIHIINRNKLKTKDLFFYFENQFALLSDIHFSQCFMPGYRKYSSYLKLKDKYMPTIDEQIHAFILKYFHRPSL